jgi:decaprenyl-phosphate phosphoribosyltransferase
MIRDLTEAQVNRLEAVAGSKDLGSRVRRDDASGARLSACVRACAFLGVLLRAVRPRQWSKNVLVVAAPCAAGAIARPHVAERVALAFVVFCLLSSATYLLNDVRDSERDCAHPRKRLRPVAAGELSERTALLAGGALAILGMALAGAVGLTLATVGLAYLAITAGYSLWWRGVVVLDIVAIAAGFVLRAAAGGAAGEVYLSRSFLLVAAFGSTFLVVGKRYAELRDTHAGSSARSTLRRYSAGSLRLLLACSALGAVVAYGLWALTGAGSGVWHVLSIVPFTLWLTRYATLVGRGAGQSPEEVIVSDRSLVALTVVWGVLFVSGVYAGH